MTLRPLYVYVVQIGIRNCEIILIVLCIGRPPNSEWPHLAFSALCLCESILTSSFHYYIG